MSTQLSKLTIAVHCISHSNCIHYAFFVTQHPAKQSGAVEACWAHNPEVGGSKPLSARIFFFIILHFWNIITQYYIIIAMTNNIILYIVMKKFHGNNSNLGLFYEPERSDFTMFLAAKLPNQLRKRMLKLNLPALMMLSTPSSAISCTLSRWVKTSGR